jgi:hypothetical protein
MLQKMQFSIKINAHLSTTQTQKLAIEQFFCLLKKYEKNRFDVKNYHKL